MQPNKGKTRHRFPPVIFRVVGSRISNGWLQLKRRSLEKNGEPLLITPQNRSYGNMNISVEKHKNFYLKKDSVLRKLVYENDNGRHAATIKDMISEIWVSYRTKTCFPGILRTKKGHKSIAWTSAPLTNVYLLEGTNQRNKIRPENSKKSWGKKPQLWVINDRTKKKHGS